MVYKFCNAESAIATCDTHNFTSKLNRKYNHHHHHRNLRHFTFTELKTATNNFSPNNLLGKGSHGAVYKAVLDDGCLIAAVKKPTSSYTLATENEIDILTRISNRRIVNLIGYTGASVEQGVTRAISNPEKFVDKFKLVAPKNRQQNNDGYKILAPSLKNNSKLLLVVEYMPNGSLYDLIHTRPRPAPWSTRVRIALQVAKAIRTLHGSEPPVIHRDIKSTNVLLDSKGNARLSDFGLALPLQVTDMRVMSTPPAGTLGYLDPCYITPDDASVKSDVFSFGILLLEIISGRRAIDVNYSPPGILEWSLPLIRAGNYKGICDPRIVCYFDRTVIRELALLAVRCVRSTVEKRPHVIEVVECIKMVYKRMQLKLLTVPMCGNNMRSQWSEMDGSDCELQKCVKSSSTSKHRSRTTRKVSNAVLSPEDRVCEMAATREKYPRGRSKSKSLGSFKEIKAGPESGPDCEINVNHLVRKRGQVTVKLSSVVRLSKSRSMSVLQSSKNVSYQGNSEVKELDVLPLLAKCSSSSKSCSLNKLVEDE